MCFYSLIREIERDALCILYTDPRTHTEDLKSDYGTLGIRQFWAERQNACLKSSLKSPGLTGDACEFISEDTNCLPALAPDPTETSAGDLNSAALVLCAGDELDNQRIEFKYGITLVFCS